MGNFNFCVRTDHQAWVGVLSRHRVGRMNSSGLRVLSICNEFSLSIPCTIFQQRNLCKTTWMYPRSEDWHLIHYLIAKKLRDFITLHVPFITPAIFLNIFFSVVRLRSIWNTQYYKSHQCPSALMFCLSKRLKSRLSSWSNWTLYSILLISMMTESLWEALHGAIHSAFVKILGHPVCNHKDLFSNSNTDSQKCIALMKQE